ncbi:MAG TPA: glycosyltransferase family 2 protein [Dongiaceae bacterium]|nr:glycosyltransferase family 2 protein [Dongiaceae bacterium]
MNKDLPGGYWAYHAHTDEPLLRPFFTGTRRLVNILAIGVWLVTLVYFLSWWFEPAHMVSVSRYVIASIPLVWASLLPAYFIFIFANAKVPSHRARPPHDSRVAIVVTKAPSEPFSLVKETLHGALKQHGFNHDTWLADEDPAPETLQWCLEHGVQVSCRKGVAEYHRTDWPRRTRCKEGNLAYFYDRYGYEHYDFVSQFDADHVPSPHYLEHAIAPFADPAVGYVSAPSICDSNAAESWSARGRLYFEASMHGALQCGYSGGWAPLCIGSHYSVRTSALRAVGGLGPELAEDHSTTLLMNAGGWRGVHAVDAIAHGEGPETFADLITQEFQWSRSLVTILLEYSPTYVPKLPGRLRFQFLFCQLWYPTFPTMMAMAFLLPMVALATGRPFVNVTYIDFLLHSIPPATALLALAYWWRRTGLLRPADAKVLSWECIAFVLLRWPWALIGSVVAVSDRLRGKVAGFRITPKGAKRGAPLPTHVIAPYMLIAAAAALVSLLVKHPGSAAGFYVFNLITATVYLFLIMLILYRHARENGAPLVGLTVSGVARTLAVAAIALAIGGAAYQNGPRGLAMLTQGFTVFTLTETVYPPSEPGQVEPSEPVVRLRPKWYGFSHGEPAPNQE